ncbi:hypothetical protein DIS24_g10065 [Lasiodiplodia hormozganensis]|uniref:Uncharacterized protein n=1 Tax=Lasiodiplodia hormozganensis TaxID=869390 RepID=A0AA39XQ67_9PEZI|nr:hypothetical protein DIS24_g10065 [Lasiodiplodia hormozganensis]
MLAMINDVTDKDEWRQKVFDESVVEKWKSEIVNDHGDNRTVTEWKEFGQGFTADMFDFCIEEVRHKAGLHEETGMTLILNTDTGVVKSDAVVSSELKQQFRAAMKPLEDVPDNQKDWHPGSNNTVLNLVDPSLFPLVYGRTRVLPHGTIGLNDCLQSFTFGEQTQVPPWQEAQSETFVQHDAKTFSTKFQWLPCDVHFEEEDNSVKIASYINNLHPAEHEDLYRALERLIAAAIPLWSLVLGYTKSHEDARWTAREDLRVPSANGPKWSRSNWTLTTGERAGVEELLVGQERAMASRFLYVPSPRAFSASAMPELSTDLRTLYASTGIQVIVKITAIHLTPEHPRYVGGGPWDIEGHYLNEHIAATALYCYDSANVIDSSTPTGAASGGSSSSSGRLSFRQKIEREHIRSLPYQRTSPSDRGGIAFVYGIDDAHGGGAAAVQEVGDVSMREGRMLAFPNVLQRRVRPLELADKTMPGYCKVVELLLVDPARRVLSTANVAPQQKGWWEAEVRGSGVLGRLPEELVQQILNEVEDWPMMGVEEARGLRLEVMEEREAFREVMERAIESHRFDLRER